MGCLGNCSQAVMGSSPGEQLPWRPEEHNHLGNGPVCPATPHPGLHLEEMHLGSIVNLGQLLG